MSSQPCRVCGLPASHGDVCRECSVFPELLHPDPAHRLAALGRSPARTHVLGAFLRGGRLWEQDPQGARVLVDWMMKKGGTTVFSWWLAEDARWGHAAWPPLVRDWHPRALLRAPVWLTRDPEHTVEAIWPWGGRPDKHAAMGFRLGSCGWDEARAARALDAMPIHARWIARMALNRGRAHPTAGTWTPDEPIPVLRRWPLPRLEPGGVLCCSVCGELLPAQGPCAMCGADPEDEPPTLLGFNDLLVDRTPCARCGVDLTTHAAPVRCPGCGLSLIDE